MKKAKRIFGVAALLAIIGFLVYSFTGCATGGASTTGNLPSITIVNDTGYTVLWVGVSETTSDTWGQDRLASDEVLSNGQSVIVQLSQQINRVNNYDIRLIDSDGDEYTKMNLTVSDNSEIVFTSDDLKYPTIYILNNTGHTVYIVNISKTTDDTWGEDRLASDQVLGNGQSVSVQLSDYIGNVNKYDIRLIDSDSNEYIKGNVTVVAGIRIEFTVNDR